MSFKNIVKEATDRPFNTYEPSGKLVTKFAV